MGDRDFTLNLEFDVDTDLRTTMQFLTYAEVYPVDVEPGWYDGTPKAEIGEVRNDGTEFDVVAGGTIIGVVYNRMCSENRLSYNLKNQPGGNPLFTIESIFELSELNGKTHIKRTMCNFTQLRNPEMPLPKKIPNTI